MSDTKRVLVLLAFATVIWSIFVFIAALSMTGSPRSALSIMFLADIPALALWTIELSILNFFHRRAFKGKSKDDNTSPRQSKTVEIDLPYGETFDLCQTAIESITGSELKVMGFTHSIKARVKSADYDMKQIIGKTRSRWWIIPDIYEEMRITLRLGQIAPHITRVHIDNRPVLPSVVFDWGYGLNNVNKIALYLREQAHLRHAESHLLESSSDDIVVELENMRHIESES